MSSKVISGSTSRHTLSADFKITKVQRVLWMLYNFANNLMPNVAVDSRMQQRNMVLAEAEIDRLWSEIGDTASPPRRLCDLFWMTLPWQQVAKEMNGVRAVEIGCGTGIYGQLMKKCLGPEFVNYLGVDIDAKEEWELLSQDSQFDFQVGRAGDANEYLSDRNMIFTQSALEHFQDDLLYFQKVADFVAGSSEPLLQLHLVPSASCLSLFPWHGVRDYTPRTLSKITRLFGDNTQAYLYSLGGKNCNRVHRKFITWPNFRHGVDLRHTSNDAYNTALRAAIIDDCAADSVKPSFYALVLASNFKEDIL